MSCFLALILYFGIVRIADVEKYWSSEILFNGLWARSMLSRQRFRAIRAFFQRSDRDGNLDDRLIKVRYLYDIMRQRCSEYWQPRQQIAIDERMIRFKGRQQMKVYVKSKPVRWGFKAYTLCDSSNAYNCSF